MRTRVHAIAAVIAFATIATFWVSTVLTELLGSEETVATVKSAIPWGFLLLVPALAATGATGFALARGSRSAVIRAKRRRMPFIIGNGLLVLVPAALYLDQLAAHGRFGPRFYGIQALELLAGAANLALLALNARDGLRLTGRLKKRRRVPQT
ncbi:hypothetical protein [Actinomadura macrotermitis]|uniref:Uncharacterized protein n=1 Tax=Actinomadura macrotermitis TaxID=2585200 RepID=A0A7K0BR44_9ACTN|nr:hypothetical protein [Actinomadura macrotermitis]MQY03650.1 hypothetical protein [Actinomadura macrotermitis]